MKKINPADAEHYEGYTVMQIAYTLAGTDADGFSALSYHIRNKWLNKASHLTCLVFNDSKIRAAIQRHSVLNQPIL